MQVTDSSGNIFGPHGLQVNGPDGKPKVISSGGGGGSIPHGTASGTDTYTVSITGVTAYNDGDSYLVRFTNGNTTGCTLNINGLGANILYRNNDGELIGGDIIDGAEMLCIYNSTISGFQVIGTAPNTLLAYVTNAESITITKGQPVYAFGGQGDRLKVKLAYNTLDATSAQTVGLVVSSSIGANQKGLIMLNGQLDGLSIFPTSTWADGDPVYLGATAGSITKIKPHAPNHLVYLGFVTTANNGSAGRMYVRVQNGYEMDELHDVQISGLADNDIIQYDLATDLWQNKSLSNAITLTTTGSSGPATLTGSTLNIPQYGGSSSLTVGTTAIASGTIGRVLFQGTGNVLQQSANLFWDNTNGRLGIGTASPSYTLQVAGTLKATGGTQAGAIFGAGVELTLASDAYIQCTSTTGKNAGLTIHRFSTAEYASIDFLNGGSFATGWSIQSRPSSTRLDIVDRNPTDNIRMCFHNGGNIGIGTTTNAGFKLDVNGTARVSGNLTLTGGSLLMNNNNIYVARGTGTPTDGMEIRALSSGTDALKVTTSSVSISSVGGLTYQASAQLAVDSTTRGFLPPRMTTAQKNAIATPAAGLIVYDTTLAKLCVRTASAWETITSV